VGGRGAAGAGRVVGVAEGARCGSENTGRRRARTFTNAKMVEAAADTPKRARNSADMHG
jgi:hypothetical protein